MPNGQFPDQLPLSNAERQARYRARRKMQQQAPVIRYRRPADRRHRLRRWLDAVTELLSLQAYYTAWFDALPEGPQDTPTAIALQAIMDLDLDELAAVVPPRGYGRDQALDDRGGNDTGRLSVAATRRDALPLAPICSGRSNRAFMITGTGVHDRVDWVFTITGIRNQSMQPAIYRCTNAPSD